MEHGNLVALEAFFGRGPVKAFVAVVLCFASVGSFGQKLTSAGGAWIRGETTDKLSGQHDVVYLLSASQAEPDAYDRVRKPHLTYVCRDGSLIGMRYDADAIIDAKYSSFSPGRVSDVSYRTDNASVQYLQWEVGDDLKSFEIHHLLAPTFAYSNEFVFRFTAHPGDVLTDVLHTSGLNAAQFERDCGIQAPK
jgi:hypothetical protein